MAFIKVNGSSYRKLFHIHLFYCCPLHIKKKFKFIYYPRRTAADYPDIELVVGAGGLSGDQSGTMRNMIGITEQFYQKVYKGVRGRPAFGLVPVLLRPYSRGRISLKSRNPFHWPRMQPHFFTNQTDITTLIQGIRRVRHDTRLQLRSVDRLGDY